MNKMLHDGQLTLPIDSHDPHFPVIQYVNDTILIVPTIEEQLIALRDMLHTFAASTGLKVNFAKSQMIPLNVSEEEATRLSGIFQCALGTLPFTYLGLPMGTTRPTVQELMPLVDSVERRLSASFSMLNQGSRL